MLTLSDWETLIGYLFWAHLFAIIAIVFVLFCVLVATFVLVLVFVFVFIFIFLVPSPRNSTYLGKVFSKLELRVRKVPKTIATDLQRKGRSICTSSVLLKHQYQQLQNPSSCPLLPSLPGARWNLRLAEAPSSWPQMWSLEA